MSPRHLAAAEGRVLHGDSRLAELAGEATSLQEQLSGALGQLSGLQGEHVALREEYQALEEDMQALVRENQVGHGLTHHTSWTSAGVWGRPACNAASAGGKVHTADISKKAASGAAAALVAVAALLHPVPADLSEVHSVVMIAWAAHVFFYKL